MGFGVGFVDAVFVVVGCYWFVGLFILIVFRIVLLFCCSCLEFVDTRGCYGFECLGFVVYGGMVAVSGLGFDLGCCGLLRLLLVFLVGFALILWLFDCCSVGFVLVMVLLIVCVRDWECLFGMYICFRVLVFCWCACLFGLFWFVVLVTFFVCVVALFRFAGMFAFCL